MVNTSKHKADFNETWYVEFGTGTHHSSLGCIIDYTLDDVIKINLLVVWCMKFKKALNKEKNTPIIRKDEIGLILKLIIASFNIRLLTLRKSVA